MAESLTRQAFVDQILYDFGATSAEAVAFSPVFECEGGRVTVSVTVAANNGCTLTVAAEGSYDGCVWLTTGLAQAGGTALGIFEQTVNAVPYAFLRLRATATLGSNKSVLFSASVAFATM